MTASRTSPRSKKADSPAQDVGDAGLAERLLEHLGLRVDAVEHGDLPRRGSRGDQGPDLLRDRRRLLGLVVERAHPRLGAVRARGRSSSRSRASGPADEASTRLARATTCGLRR